LSLQLHGLGGGGGLGPYIGRVHEEPGAGVPAEKGVVVSDRPHFLGPLVARHRGLDPLVRKTPRPGSALLVLALGAALADDSRVVLLIVLAYRPVKIRTSLFTGS